MLNNNQNTSPAMQHIEIEKLPVKYFSSAVCMGHIRGCSQMTPLGAYVSLSSAFGLPLGASN